MDAYRIAIMEKADRAGLSLLALVKSSSARAADRELSLAPTFVSGQLFLRDLRANALAYGSISRRTNKAVARACHRRYWPKTNVGASDPLRGRCSISQAQ